MARRLRKRMSKEATRERLIDAGLELLTERGVELGLGHVTIEGALRRANAKSDELDEVARSSAFSVWANVDDAPPQAVFQRRVLRALLDARQTKEFLMDTADIVDAAATTPDREGADALPIESLLRKAGELHIEYLTASREARTTLAITGLAVAAAADDEDEELISWLREEDERWRAAVIRDVYLPQLSKLGLSPRKHFGDRAVSQFALAAQALAEGISLRQQLGEDLAALGSALPNASGEAEEWTLFGLTLNALVNYFFEPAEEPG